MIELVVVGGVHGIRLGQAVLTEVDAENDEGPHGQEVRLDM
jgi:hypothetical protein